MEGDPLEAFLNQSCLYIESTPAIYCPVALLNAAAGENSANDHGSV